MRRRPASSRSPSRPRRCGCAVASARAPRRRCWCTSCACPRWSWVVAAPPRATSTPRSRSSCSSPRSCPPTSRTPARSPRPCAPARGPTWSCSTTNRRSWSPARCRRSRSGSAVPTRPSPRLRRARSSRASPAAPASPAAARRVILDPNDPSALEVGEILVAPITDPSWTPLFVAASAVVVDVGAPFSHAAIVSRELGIPCVVSATDATGRIPDGALIEVDGTTATVTVIEA
ncbi:PEP-utilizing enzyme [Pseudonocardia sp. ICBG601]|uniref:PEP-utilizing enzyme n=1 Tax=Pseudonocardia sp. ICBG601 TaxID=2846759 RepID=UPI001CF611A9|nr:PEP-utilizing enzyme [Pseudonocardia sp. ICBG601]